MKKKYYFKKYYPEFCSGFTSSVDEVTFNDWDEFMKKYNKEFPLSTNYFYAFSNDTYCIDNPKYALMSVSKDGENWWVEGYTNFPLDSIYENYENFIEGYLKKLEKQREQELKEQRKWEREKKKKEEEEMKGTKKVPYNWLHWQALDLEVEAYTNGIDVYHIEFMEKLRKAVVRVHKEGFYSEWYMEVDMNDMEAIKQEIRKGWGKK
jgi:hypothetical protein